MCFAKQLLLLFLVNQEKLLVVLAECLKNLCNQVHFKYSYFSDICQEFYLDFKLLLLLNFRFPRARIFQNTSFSHPLMVGVLDVTRQLPR